MNRNVFIRSGITLLILTFIMSLVSTIAYGGNFVPRTTPEAIHDLTKTLMLLTGFVMAVVGNAMPKNKS